MGTQTHIMIEPKGVDSFSAPNRFAMIVCSNDAKVIDIDPDDRRWLAIEVSAAWKGDLERFARLVEHWRDGGGREAFYEHLKGVDLSEFNHRRRPITKTHTEQVEHSLKGATRVVQAMLARGETPPVMRDGVEKFCPYRNSGEVFVPTSDAIDWGRRKGLLNRLDESLETAMGRELAKASALKGTIRKSVYGRFIRGVWLAPLKEARERWNRESGLDLEWDEDGGAWDVIPAGSARARDDGSIDDDSEPEVPF